jgi:hypothetical protein
VAKALIVAVEPITLRSGLRSWDAARVCREKSLAYIEPNVAMSATMS